MLDWYEDKQSPFKSKDEYFIKKDAVNRVQNARKLEDIFYKNNLNLLSVPEQYLCQIPGQPSNISDKNYVAVERKITGTHGASYSGIEAGAVLNLEQTKQLSCMINKTPYYDLHNKNYLVTTDKKIVIIDTDSFAMPPKWFHLTKKLLWFLTGSDRYNPLAILHYRNVFEQRTEDWLDTEMNKSENMRKLTLAACIIASVSLYDWLKK